MIRIPYFQYLRIISPSKHSMNSKRNIVSHWIPILLFFVYCSRNTVSVYKPNNCGPSSVFLCIDELLVRAQLCRLFCKIISQSLFSILWINKLLSELFWASGQTEQVFPDLLTWFRIIINCCRKCPSKSCMTVYLLTSF